MSPDASLEAFRGSPPATPEQALACDPPATQAELAEALRAGGGRAYSKQYLLHLPINPLLALVLDRFLLLFWFVVVFEAEET